MSATLLIAVAIAACGGDKPSPAQLPITLPGPSPTPSTIHPSTTPLPTATFSAGQVILPTVNVTVGVPTPISDDPINELLAGIALRVNLIRELTTLEKQDAAYITQADYLDRITQDLEKDRKNIDALGQLYTLLGILRPTQDLFGILANLYGETVLGFFDRDQSRMYVVKDLETFGPAEFVTYAHEYTHFLQQQYFDFSSQLDDLKDESDELRAYLALLEGDATLTESIYMLQYLSDEERQIIQEAPAERIISALQAAPHVVRRTYFFPYVEGFQFAYGLFLSSGWAGVDHAFRDPPRSTEQVMHPDKYLLGELPIEISLPDLATTLGPDWRLLREDSLGQFVLMAYLETALEPIEALEAASGWGGDRYAVVEGPEGEVLAAWLVSWDSEGDATEFFDGYVNFLAILTGFSWEPSATPGSRTMLLPDRTVRFSIDGLSTMLAVSTNSTALDTVIDALEDAGKMP